MRRELLEFLACPACGAELEAGVEEEVGGEMLAGTLTCLGCTARYPVLGGVPRMNLRMDDLERVASAFSFEWKAHHEGKFESKTLWGRTPAEHWALFTSWTGTSERAIAGAVVLDAGCGSAAFTRLIAEHGARAVIGVDMGEAVDEARWFCRDLPNVHIVQANLLALPLKPAICDLIWCSGVLHHMPDPAAGHRSLSRHVRPGGTLHVKVAAKRFSPFHSTRRVLATLRVTRLPAPALLWLSRALSYPSLALLWLYRTARRLPGLRPRGGRAGWTVRRRPLREIQLTWFDVLSPEFASRHTESEVIGWFEREGFEAVTALEEPKVGVRGRAPA